MSDLEIALKAYRDTVATATLNLDDVPLRVRAGKESQKRQAEANLVAMLKLYAIELRKASFGVAVTGPSAAEFVKLFKEETETALVVNGAQIYKRIADRVFPAMGSNREFGVSHYSMMITELRVIADELDIASMPSPKWTEPVNVADEGGLLNHVRNMVDSSAGVELTSLYLSRQIVSEGLAFKSDEPTVPVLVTGLEPKTADELLSKTFPEGRFTLVKTKEVTTKEDVLEVIKTIKQQIKNSKKNKTN